MTRLLLLVPLLLVALAGCGRNEEVSPQDSIAADIQKIKRDPNAGQKTPAMARLDAERARHGGKGGPMSK